MYTDDITRQVDGFIGHPTKKVLVLSGPWGVGKTYFWRNRYIPHLAKQRKDQKYAYVSLFGLESVDDIEQLILAKTTTLSKAVDGKPVSIRKIFEWMDDIPKLNEIAGLAKRIGRIFIRDLLICFDDMERRGAKLAVSSILGFISQLREENNCRVVLIMNGEELDKDAQAELTRYREKVVDETIQYSPPKEHNVALVFPKDNAIARDVFERLDTNNIRVMQQASWTLEYFQPFLKGMSQKTHNQFREQVLLLTCFYHESGLGICIDDLPSETLASFYMKQAKDGSEKSRKLLSQYRYAPTEFDRYIVEYLKSGKCDEAVLRLALKSVDAVNSQRSIQQTLYSLWERLGSNFRGEFHETMGVFEDFMDKNSSRLGIHDLQQALTMMKQAGASKRRLDGWEDAFISERAKDADYETLIALQKGAHSRSLKQQIGSTIRKKRGEFSAVSAIHVIVMKGGWSQEVVARLNALSINDYEREFLQCESDRLIRDVQGLFDTWKKAGEGPSAVLDKINQALAKIAKKNRLNALRVATFFPDRPK